MLPAVADTPCAVALYHRTLNDSEDGAP